MPEARRVECPWRLRRGLFEALGQWLARFVVELNEYLPVQVDYVEAWQEG